MTNSARDSTIQDQSSIHHTSTTSNLFNIASRHRSKKQQYGGGPHHSKINRNLFKSRISALFHENDGILTGIDLRPTPEQLSIEELIMMRAGQLKYDRPTAEFQALRADGGGSGGGNFNRHREGNYFDSFGQPDSTMHNGHYLDSNRITIHNQAKFEDPTYITTDVNRDKKIDKILNERKQQQKHSKHNLLTQTMSKAISKSKRRLKTLIKKSLPFATHAFGRRGPHHGSMVITPPPPLLTNPHHHPSSLLDQ